MTDEEHAKLREAYIKDGIIKPTGEVYQEGEHPPMASWIVKDLKEKLIAKGILKPRAKPVYGNGKHYRRYQ